MALRANTSARLRPLLTLSKANKAALTLLSCFLPKAQTLRDGAVTMPGNAASRGSHAALWLRVPWDCACPQDQGPTMDLGDRRTDFLKCLFDNLQKRPQPFSVEARRGDYGLESQVINWPLSTQLAL